MRKHPWEQWHLGNLIRALPLEREAAEVLSLRLAFKGQSGPCICDHCIARIWRPLIAQLGAEGKDNAGRE